MREIKFRVWDTALERFISHEFLSMNCDGEVTEVFDNGRDVEDLTENKQAVISQYTGLKDKNGTEIYEGDILKITCNFEQRKETVVDKVEFYNSSFSCNDWLFCELIDNAVKNRQEWEVIGNIYENKELINHD